MSKLSSPDSSSSIDQPSSKFTILNVDDDETNRYAISQVLKRAGFAVQEAASGKQALKMLKEAQPDLVLLDVHLPDISGLEVCSIIKADPATAMIPVLHISGIYVDSQSQVVGLESGADAYLTQPIDPPVLIASIKALLRMHQAESKVISAARKWQATFDTISDGVCLLDEGGRIVQCNQSMMSLLSKPASEIIGQRCGELIGCERLDTEGSCFAHLRESGQRESFNWQIGERWFRVSLDPVMDETGRFIGAVEILTDISRQKLADDEHERLFKLLEAVIQQMPAGVIIAEVPGGKMLLGNKQVEKIFRHPFLWSENIEQYGQWSGFHQNGRPYSGEEWPLARSILSGEVVINEEVSICRGDGSQGVITISSAPIRDRAGEIVAAVVTFSDITERKKIEEELHLYRNHLEELVREQIGELSAANERLRQEIEERRQAEERLRESELKYATVVEQARDWVLIIQDGVFRFSNRVAAEISGYRAEEILGRPFADIVPIEQQDMLAEQSVSLRSAGHDLPSFLEIKIKCKDGTSKDAEMSAGLIQYQGRPAIVAVIRDITERKRLEEERQRADKLESIGVLAGGIAHDFNNILTAVLGNLSLAKMHTPPESRAFRLLSETEKSSLRARDLTQQLLTFAKGGAPIKKIASIGELLKETATFALRGSRVRAEFSLAEDLWLTEVDVGQISQVINNLIINAKQAMPEGGKIKVFAENITLRAGSGEDLPLEPGRYLKITIEDEGVGIPAEHLQSIFDPYFTTKDGGSGLGLATSYSIIKKHGGYIRVRSKLGVGTKFSIYLPASAEQSMETAPEQALAGPPTGQGRILIMDDEQSIRTTVRHMLEFLGYQVETARDGQEAVALYQRAREDGHPFDAVILDLTVPCGMGGEQAIGLMQRIDPEVKAIASSGYSNDAIMADFRQWGFCAAIAKPYQIEDLAKLLYRIVVKK